MKVIDTDVVIDLFHGHQPALDFLILSFSRGEQLVISVITVTEILSGLRPGEEERTEILLNLFMVQGADEHIARRAGDYIRGYRRSHKMELGDALIAGTAHQLGADLITRNVKHYPMSDISIVVPYERGRR